MSAIMTEWLKTPTGTMSLRKEQAWALAEIAEVEGLFGPVGVGIGKTGICLLAPTVLEAQRPLLILPAATRDEKTIKKDIPELAAHWRLHPRFIQAMFDVEARKECILSYEELSRESQADAFQRIKPDLIVLDECFLGDVLVKTDKGEIAISEIVEKKLEVKVLSKCFASKNKVWRSVTGRLKKEREKPLVIIHHEKGQLICTANHKIWTQEKGYVEAKDLLNLTLEVSCEYEKEKIISEREILPKVRDALSRVLVFQEEILQQEMFSAKQSAYTRGSKTPEECPTEIGRLYQRENERSFVEHGSPSTLLGENAPEQPVKKPGNACKNSSGFKGENFFVEGGKREADETTDSFVSAARLGRVEDGMGYIDKSCVRHASEPSAPLQSGLGNTRTSFGDRGRRGNAQDKEMEVFGQAEDRSSECVRVVCVEVLEQRSGRECPQGSRESKPVYCIEVEGTHNFYADGVLVSNCHRAKNKKSAVWRRIERYFLDYPGTKMVAVSGTITTKSLRDYAHLAKLCLKDKSPLPHRWADLEDWADALDEGVDPDQRPDPGALELFCKVGDTPRQGFRRRLLETKGVVATESPSSQASITISELPVSPPLVVREAFEKMRSEWLTPGGDIIMTALELAAHLMELACGFYYRWKWANGVVDQEWLDARKAWRKYVRESVKLSGTSKVDGQLFDTEQQVASACSQGRLRPPLDEYNVWRNIRGRSKPETEPVWISEYLVDVGVAWLKKPHEVGASGLVWTEHKALLERLRPRVEALGLRAYGAGQHDVIYETKSCVVSIDAHGEGKNLQAHHSRNLFLCAPTNAKVWEQAIGRTHRQGQKADEVTVELVLPCIEFWASVEKSRKQAKYIEATTGQQQRLNVADVIIPGEAEILKRAKNNDPLWVKEISVSAILDGPRTSKKERNETLDSSSEDA